MITHVRPTSSTTPDRSAFETDPTRRAFCPSCKSSTETITQRNRDGHVYCRCLTCARRFRF